MQMQLAHIQEFIHVRDTAAFLQQIIAVHWCFHSSVAFAFLFSRVWFFCESRRQAFPYVNILCILVSDG